MFNTHSIVFEINLGNSDKLCVSLSPDLLYPLFHNTVPGTKALSELKVTYSVFVCRYYNGR